MLLRALRGLGSVALLLTLFEACSGSEANPPKPPAGPAKIEIKEIALGHGFYNEFDPTSHAVTCDYTIGVNVELEYWTLYPPGRCAGALQCGQLRVRLEDSGQNTLLELTAAGNGVAMDVSSLADDEKSIEGSYQVVAELIEDSGHPYVEVDGGDGSARKTFDMVLPARSACKSTQGSGGSGGAGGSGGGPLESGSGGESLAAAGTGGAAGSMAGTGSAAGGMAGTAGAGEVAGTAGIDATGGSAGTAGTAGIAGTAEIAGNGGIGGSTP